MAVGEVFYFETNQATGYEGRKKYHVLIDVSAGPPQEYIFMFISTNDYGFDFPISTEACSCLEYDSYISCGKLVRYDYNELIALKLTKAKVTLARDVLRQLYEHLDGHEVLPGKEIAIARAGLAKGFAT